MQIREKSKNDKTSEFKEALISFNTFFWKLLFLLLCKNVFGKANPS